MDISKRVGMIAPSGSIAIASKITNLRKNGEKIIGLNVGEPDFDAPESVIKATVKALKEGKTRYSLVSGELCLRQEIASYFSGNSQKESVKRIF